MTREPVDKVRLAIVGASIVAWLVVLALAASAQEMGHHPPAGQVDPYAKARDLDWRDCCQGKDCKPYYGPPPVRQVKDGVSGWLVGKWFFTDRQRIRPETLAKEIQGEPSICVGEGVDYELGHSYRWEAPRCFYYPYTG